MDSLTNGLEFGQENTITKEQPFSQNIPSDAPENIELSIDKKIIPNKNIHKTLEERVAKSDQKIKFSNEINWGYPQGLEVW